MDRKDYDNGNEGGFINPKHNKSRQQRIRWDAANDRKLLLLAMGREMSSKEWAIIAASFKEKPTPKSVQERYTKLRAEQRGKLRELGILDDDKLAKIHDVPPGDLVPGEDYTDDEDDGRDNITVKTTTPASDDLFYTPVDNTNKGKKKKTAPGKPPAKKVRRSAVIDDDDDDDDTTVTPLAPETEEESKARRVAEGRKAYYGS